MQVSRHLLLTNYLQAVRLLLRARHHVVLGGHACEGGVWAGRALAKADVRVRVEAVAGAAAGAAARDGARIGAALRAAPAPDALDLV